MPEPLVEIIGDALFEYCDKLGLPPSITRPYGFAEQVAPKVRAQVAAEIAEAIGKKHWTDFRDREEAILALVHLARQHATPPAHTPGDEQ